MLRCVVILMLLASSTVHAAEPIEIVAHRGASYDAPENTVAAIQLAWKQGADASEFDVLLSSDGKIVVMHDKDTQRTAGVKQVIVDTPFADLRQLDVGKWKGAAFTGEKIPTLDEMLATIPEGKRVFIEVKCGPEIVPELKRVLANAKRPAVQTPVISFNANVIAAVKKEIPELKAYWLASVKRDATTGKAVPSVEQLIERAQAVRADGLNLSANRVIDEAFVRAANAANLPVYVWTVNDPELARAMVKAGVKTITTDRPAWLREQLRQGDR